MLVPEGIPLELPSQLPGRNRWTGRLPPPGDSHRPADRQHRDFPRDANVVHCAMLSIFCAPARYVQGRNATASLGAEMKKLGLAGTAFVVAGRTAARLLADTWRQTFAEVDIGHAVHPFGGECSRLEIERGKAAALAARATVVVGAGGGKVLDTARAIAADLSLPVVNCPTVASSDAPCSALSVVYTEEGEFERYLFYRRNPDLVLVDTTVIASSPVRLLVAGMGDALATWFEANTVVEARKANQVGGATTISAAALARLCYETLLRDGKAARQALEVQAVTPALERLVEANTLLSGLGFESGGLAVAHSVHNGLTVAPATHAYLHGEKVSFGLVVQLVLEGRPAALLDEVLAFAADVGLPTQLSDLGLGDASRDLVAQIASRATAPGETAHNEPFAVDATMVADAIRAADAESREWRARNVPARLG
jgi:glycerol dehydrogenase